MKALGSKWYIGPNGKRVYCAAGPHMHACCQCRGAMGCENKICMPSDRPLCSRCWQNVLAIPVSSHKGKFFHGEHWRKLNAA